MSAFWNQFGVRNRMTQASVRTRAMQVPTFLRMLIRRLSFTHRLSIESPRRVRKAPLSAAGRGQALAPQVTGGAEPAPVEPRYGTDNQSDEYEAWDGEAEVASDAWDQGDCNDCPADEELQRERSATTDEDDAQAQRQLPPGGHRASGSQTNSPSSAMDVEPARRPLGWNGKPKGRQLFRPDEVRLATHVRLLILDRWRRSGLPAGTSLHWWDCRSTPFIFGRNGLSRKGRLVWPNSRGAPRPAASCRKCLGAQS
jgi:hypothetical protein